MTKQTNRRRFLGATGAAALGLLGGCAGQFSVASSEATTTSPASDPAIVRHDHQTESRTFSDETLAKAREVGTAVQRSVVKLTNGNAGGTGWILEDGYVVTNSHVAYESETMDVETFDERTGTATRVGYHRDMTPDVALLKTGMETPSPLAMETDATLSKGDPLLAVGHPGSVGDWVISLGTYDSYRPMIDWILADIPADNGNSGSPLVTLDGAVVGCVSGSMTMGERRRVSRSEKVFTTFPEREQLATATPSKTVEKWVGEWK
jgi:S1-C subfamily serine protease